MCVFAYVVSVVVVVVVIPENFLSVALPLFPRIVYTVTYPFTRILPIDCGPFSNTLCVCFVAIFHFHSHCVCVPSVQNLFHRYCSSFFCIGLSSSFATFAIIGGALSIRYQFVHEWYNSIIVQREREWELERELNANVHRKHFVAFYCLCYYCLRIISISISILLNCVQ